MTNLEFVSRVGNSLRAINKDAHISRRYILKVGRNKSKFLISQKLRDRTLYKESNIVSYIECFELQPITTFDCGIVEFKNCKNLMKSTKKLPELIYSRYGSSIVEVTSIDGEVEFSRTTPRKYRNDSKRIHTKYLTTKFFYEKDSYLYLPDSRVEMVGVGLITLETEKLEAVSACNESGDCAISIWDREFIVSDKLDEVVISETVKEIAGTYMQITPDTNPNMDENQRGKTTN